MEDTVLKKTKVRGNATFDGMHFTFTPEKKGEPVQKDVVSKGKSKFYTTSGKKTQTYVAHLVADANVADPEFELVEQLKALLAQRGKAMPAMEAGDVTIAHQDHMTIQVNRGTRQMYIYLNVPLQQPEMLFKKLHMLQAKVTSELYLAENVVKKLLKE